MRKFLFIVSLIFLLGCSVNDENKKTEVNEVEEVDNEANNEEVEHDVEIEFTKRDYMINDILDLIDEGLAFDIGYYTKGDIPKGEYAFVKFEGNGSYYSEVDSGGNIIDNENFDSFGYVKVYEAGDVETNGVLVSVEALNLLDVKGAKEVYEILNEIEDYDESGYYRVGYDIEPGEYTIESYGSGYIGIMSGPVGDSKIIKNDHFEGSYKVELEENQYLVVSRSYIK